MVLFDFNVNSDLSNWKVVDDVVMGGRSDGNLMINADGHAVFHGDVSLKNNGGFSSVRCDFDAKIVNDYTQVKLRIKGDGKAYQFRVKSNSNERHSYIFPFQASGEWQTITIPLADMQPSFRGRKLDMPNYPGEQLEQITFLIGNKKEESFSLIVDHIILE